jgi:CheY-like chemotaxis protein
MRFLALAWKNCDRYMHPVQEYPVSYFWNIPCTTDSMIGQKPILVVDDDPDDVELFSDALKKVDDAYYCISVRNAVLALQKLKDHEADPPEYIFVDLNMPGMNGLELLAEIKKNKSLAQIPVVIYSTTSRREDREMSIKLGAMYFFTKPVHFVEICQNIRKVLEFKSDSQ